MFVKKKILILFSVLLICFIFNESLIYYIVLYQCNWPSKLNGSVKAMLLADTHLLGPFKGNWFDKLRREWQMFRAFQTAIVLHQPDVVFILGDVFDEGQWVNDKDFEIYINRFQQLFHAGSNSKHIRVYSAIGNHDVGFHYRLYPPVVNRFKKAFEKTDNSLITINNVHFVMINSMTMAQDGCYFCEKAKSDVRKMANQLNCAKLKTKKACDGVEKQLQFYSRPILLQHFPTYRNSDEVCEEHDSPEIEIYRENWEVLSKSSTKFLGQLLNPRVAFSGHSHHYCRTYNNWGIEEFTIASFSWRNKNNPSFLLAEFTEDDYAIAKCNMPRENTVLAVYLIGIILSLLFISMATVLKLTRKIFKKKTK